MNYQQNQGFIRTIDSFIKENPSKTPPIKLIFTKNMQNDLAVNRLRPIFATRLTNVYQTTAGSSIG